MRISQRTRNVSIDIDTARIDRNVREAQKLLNLQVTADCTPLVPFQQGALRSGVNYPQGVYGGEIEWEGPYAHYLYKGEVYGPNIPIYDSGGSVTDWYSPPHKHPTGRAITYHTPGTGKEWFEVSKQRNLQSWLRLVKETAGRG